MAEAPTSRKCPDCGHSLPPGVPSMLCPHCVLAGALEAAAEFPDSNRTMGRWTLLEELGRGGMGVVYRAVPLAGGAEVALKTLAAGELATPEARRRFRAEAEAAAALRHPHLVPIHEVGEHDGTPFLVMTLIGGGTLAARLAGGAVPAQEAVALLRTVADAVQSMHGAGILHRDLKPSNILLDEAGRPFVGDFGLAKVLDAGHVSHRTRTGQVLGSPAYMAPEQARGENARTGPASDVYAMGAILYHLLTGRAPFAGASLHEVLQQVQLSEPRPLRSVRAEVPRDLETVCLHCLEKNPAERYATAREFSEDLARWQAGLPVLARRPGPVRRGWRWCRRRPVVAGLAAVIFLLACVLGTHVLATRNSHAAEQARRLASAGAAALDEAQAAVSDHQPGRRSRGLSALRRAGSRGNPAVVRDTAITLLTGYSFEARAPLPLPAGARAAAFSAELRHAAWVRDGIVHVIRTSDGMEVLSFDEAATRRPEDGVPERLEFSPGGGLIAVHSARGLVRVWRFSSFRADRQSAPSAAGDPAGVQPCGSWQTTASVALGFTPVFMKGEGSVGLRLAPGGDHPQGALVLVTLADGKSRIIRDAPAAGDFFLANPVDSSAVISHDGVLDVIDLETGSGIGSIKAPARVTASVWQPEGTRLMAGCANGAVLLCSVYNKFNIAIRARQHSAPLSHVSFCGPRLVIVTAGEDGFMRVSQAGSGDEVFLEMAGLTGQASSRDGRVLGAVDAAGRLLLWDKLDAVGVEAMGGIVGAKFESWDIDFAPESGTLLMASAENLLLKDGRDTIMGLYRAPQLKGGAAFMPGAGLVVAVDNAAVWALNASALGTAPALSQALVVEGDPAWLPRRFCFGADGTIAVESADNRYGIAHWPLLSDVREFKGRRASALPGPGGGPGGSGMLAVSPDGARVSGGFPDAGPAVIWSATEGTVVKELPEPGVVHFSPDGRWFLLGSDTRWRLFDAKSWREVWTLPRLGSERQLGTAAFAADGATVLLDTAPLRLSLLETGTSRVMANFTLPQSAACTSVRYDSAAGRLYAGTRSNSVWRWDLKELRQALKAEGIEPGF